MQLAAQHIPLAVHPTIYRLFVSDATFENRVAVHFLTAYRTADWSVDLKLQVPSILLPIGGTSALAPSTDGQYRYVLNYNQLARESEQTPLRYWLSALDLQGGQWLPQTVDLPGCGVGQLVPMEPSRLAVLCHDADDVRIVDTATMAAVQMLPVVAVERAVARGRRAEPSYAVWSGQRLAVVTENREVHVFDAGAGQAAERVLTSAAAKERIVPLGIPVGLGAEGKELLVPSGTTEEVSRGVASELAVVDAATGQVVRSVRPSQPFRWAAFSADGASAWLSLTDQRGLPARLVRLDLQTGAETVVLDQPVSSGFVVAP